MTDRNTIQVGKSDIRTARRYFMWRLFGAIAALGPLAAYSLYGTSDASVIVIGLLTLLALFGLVVIHRSTHELLFLFVAITSVPSRNLRRLIATSYAFPLCSAVFFALGGHGIIPPDIARLLAGFFGGAYCAGAAFISVLGLARPKVGASSLAFAAASRANKTDG